MDSMRKNFFYNLVLLIVNTLFQLIFYPYATRIIGVENMGNISFAQSVVQYFLYIGSLGIPIYGIREIGKVRHDKEKRTKIFLELFIIQLLMNLLCIVVYFIIIFQINKLYLMRNILLMFSINILLNCFSVDWFFQGIEDFKYITKRSLIIKSIAILILIFFVKNADDYLKYVFIFVIITSGANFLNMISIKKFLCIKRYTLKFKYHLKPVFIIFLSSLVTTIYGNFDITMIGIYHSNKEVAYYSMSMKVCILILSLINALSAITIPKISEYINSGDENSLIKVLKISIQYVLILGTPIVFGINLLGKDILIVLFGESLVNASSMFKLLSLVILLSGICNFLGMQVLIPSNKEKYFTLSVIYACILNIFLNVFLIPKFSGMGATVASIAVEIFNLAYLLFHVSKNVINIIFDINNLKFIISSVVMYCILDVFLNVFHIVCNNKLLNLLSYTMLGCLVYVIILIVLKEKLSVVVINKVKRKFNAIIKLHIKNNL